MFDDLARDNQPDLDDELDELEADEDLSVPPRREPPPLRGHDYKRGHRQTAPASKARMGERSPWERPRDNFTQAMSERESKGAMNTTAGRTVSAGRNVGK